jgi:hypothetical protein
MHITSFNNAQAVIQADNGSDNPLYPKTTDIPVGEYTVPIATAHCRAITITVEGVPTEAAVGIVECRAGRDAQWYEYTQIDFSEGAGSERFDNPSGQIRVQATVAGATVYVQGIEK